MTGSHWQFDILDLIDHLDGNDRFEHDLINHTFLSIVDEGMHDNMVRMATGSTVVVSLAEVLSLWREGYTTLICDQFFAARMPGAILRPAWEGQQHG